MKIRQYNWRNAEFTHLKIIDFSLNILCEQRYKRTLVKVPLQQHDLLLKMNISLNGCEWVKSVAKRLLKISATSLTLLIFATAWAVCVDHRPDISQWCQYCRFHCSVGLFNALKLFPESASISDTDDDASSWATQHIRQTRRLPDQ